MSSFLKWLDNRTGYQKLVSAMLIEEIPGGAKWRYVWGSCLAFVFSIQLITGILLMTAYSPSSATAWGSVYFIQYQMEFGWLIRGIHHFGSQTMVVLLAIHMLQVVIAGAHLPPREVNWWLGMALLGAVLGLSLTGYLLPWDQKGYWATQVATNIAANVPVIGSWIQQVAIGGPEYGNHTLTRFFALHVGILPPLIVVLIVAHIAVFRRHGVTHPKNPSGEGWFWPDQAFRDLVACLIVFAVLILVVSGAFGHHGHPLPSAETDASVWQKISLAGAHYGAGANLDAPADPSNEYPARPEWYFLFLFQLLKYFEGSQELIGTVVVPGAVATVLLLLPLIGRGRLRPAGHFVGVVVMVGLLGGVVYMTYEAMAEDAADADFQQKLANASAQARRSVTLAKQGIPPEGPINLLRRDPQTEGRRLFSEKCAVCHRFGELFTDGNKACDLANAYSEDWIYGLLKNPGNPKYFGNTDLTGMIEWAEDMAKADEIDRPSDEDLRTISKWLAGRPEGIPPEEDEESEFAVGYLTFSDWCLDCHVYEGDGAATAPDFTRYGDDRWIRGMIMAPDHPSRYGGKNRMPIYRDLDGPDADQIREDLADRLQGEHASLENLTALQRELIIGFLRGEEGLVYGGDPVTTLESKDKPDSATPE